MYVCAHNGSLCVCTFMCLFVCLCADCRENVMLQGVYHPGLFTNGKWSCCDHRSKHSQGCCPSFCGSLHQENNSPSPQHPWMMALLPHPLIPPLILVIMGTMAPTPTAFRATSTMNSPPPPRTGAGEGEGPAVSLQIGKKSHSHHLFL